MKYTSDDQMPPETLDRIRNKYDVSASDAPAIYSMERALHGRTVNLGSIRTADANEIGNLLYRFMQKKSGKVDLLFNGRRFNQLTKNSGQGGLVGYVSSLGSQYDLETPSNVVEAVGKDKIALTPNRSSNNQSSETEQNAEQKSSLKSSKAAIWVLPALLAGASLITWR